MGNYNKVLWTLDNETQPLDFERLCIDLLGREGYRHIIPGSGTKDLGRDAELLFWGGVQGSNAVVAFQFSLESRWEAKLKKDAEKVITYCPQTTLFVFVTSQQVTVARRDQLKEDFQSRHGLSLTIYDREWLRHRLEELNPDLAKKHLDLDIPVNICSTATLIELPELDDDIQGQTLWQQSPELVRASIRESTRKEPASISNWRHLARAEYLLGNYDEALLAVNRAIELTKEDALLLLNFRMEKGGFLAEKGMRVHSRPLLVEAKDILVDAMKKLQRPNDYYNTANVLSALGETDEADRFYRRCLELNPEYTYCWVNWGNLLIGRGEHAKGIECLDKALSLRPNLIEAHLAKAKALFYSCKNPELAINSFEATFKLDPDLERRWKYARTCFSQALLVAGHTLRALEQVQISYVRNPGDEYLLNQKAAVLSALWRENRAYEAMALEFFQFRARAIENDHPGLFELAMLCEKLGGPEAALPLIDSNLDCGDFSFLEITKKVGFTMHDIQAGLERFPFYQRFRSTYSVQDLCVMLHKYGLYPDGAIVTALDQLLMIPFGVAARRLSALSESERIGEVHAVFEVILNQISKLFPIFGARWLTNVKPLEQEEQTRLLSIACVYLADVVVAEAGRHFGFLTGHFGISSEIVRQNRQRDWNGLCAEVGADLFEQVAKEWEWVNASNNPSN